MKDAQATKTLGTLIILGFAWSVGGIEAWGCAALIIMAVWAETEHRPPKEEPGGMSVGWRAKH
jgi:hypothetical protein